MSEIASTDLLAKNTLAELRAAHGDVLATRETLLRFFQHGLSFGLSLQECMRMLFFEPCQAGSLFRRVGYAAHEYDRMVQMVRELPLHEVLSGICAEPDTPPNDGPAERLGNSRAKGGPPLVS